MTPKVLKIEQVSERIVELSTGTAFDGSSIYGVSVLEWREKKKDFVGGHPLSTMKQSKSEAEEYFDEVVKSL